MKKIFILPLFSAIILQAQGNVGINTTAPTNTLDVNGTLRVRTMPLNTTSVYNLVTDGNGVVGTNPSRFISSNSVTATAPVEISYTSNVGPGGGTVTYSPLNVSNTITVPVGAKYGIFSSYSVPVGASTPSGEYTIVSGSNTYSFPINFAAYVGVGFYKNGVLVEGPTRKYSFPTRTDNNYFGMTTVSANYYEIIDNSTGTGPLTINYSLSGYLEPINHNANNPAVASSGTVRFNMWDANSSNYNWGKSTLTNIVYQLP